MARTGSTRAVTLAMVSLTIASGACTQRQPPAASLAPKPIPGLGGSTVRVDALVENPVRETPRGGLSGDVRVIQRAGADTTLGPILITAEPLSPALRTARTPQRVLVASSTERFAPDFTVLAAGDSAVFVNGGTLSHRLFSADLGTELQVPVRPGASSEPVAIHHRGEARFFCSLHPDESFDLLVTASAPSSAIDQNGWYDIWPLEDGTYQLSIWTPRVSGPVRIVEVTAGHLSIETIWIDPDLIGR